MINNDRKRRNRKRQLFLMAVLGLLAIITVIIILINLSINDDKILKNVYVEDIDVSNMTKDKARDVISNNYKNVDVLLNLDGNEVKTNLNELGVDMDIDKILDDALNVTQNKNIFSKFKTIFSHKFLGKKTKISVSNKFNEEELEKNIIELTNKFNKDAKNAKITINGGIINITPEEKGYKVNSKKLTDDLVISIKNHISPIKLNIPIEESLPTIKEVDLSEINGRIARYITTFNTSESERSYNISLAASRISNKLLMPGDEMSFLETVGDISEAAGYKNSTVIENNEYVDGIGGGVCQVSTTLYNAVLLADLGITYRVNHTFPSNYAPMGRDATVAIPGPDFKFKNKNSYPVYIINYTSGNKMISEVYGDINKHVPTEIYSEVLETYEPETKYIDDPDLPKGKEVVEKKGKSGYKVATYKVQNGQKSRITLDTYKKMEKVVRRGTGPKEKKSEEKMTKKNNNPATPTETPSNTNLAEESPNSKQSPDNNQETDISPIF